MRAHTHTRAHTYTYTRTHIHIHAHTHTHMHTLILAHSQNLRYNNLLQLELLHTAFTLKHIYAERERETDRGIRERVAISIEATLSYSSFCFFVFLHVSVPLSMQSFDRSFCASSFTIFVPISSSLVSTL